ncbi:MAG: hydantoinase/oxoprolinase family protein [Reyranellaceae bacterium]
MLWVGVDVGGTFTDGVLYNSQTKEFMFAKVPSTPGDPASGVIDVIKDLDVNMEAIDRFVHGVTIGTNTILQHRGAKVWMIVTKGFGDVLEIARTNRGHQLYDIRTVKPAPIVPRTQSIEISERVAYDGTEVLELDEREIRRVLRGLPIAENDAIAICFLHSYLHPKNEQRVAEIVRDECPGVYVCTSSDVLAQFREYERFNTTALNAYIGPLMARYLTNLRNRLGERGYRNGVFITTSNGGSAPAERAIRLPISTVLSGPAGGVAAALHLGRDNGLPNLITCDMGGTSTDVCLVTDSEAPVTNEQFIGGYANRTPQIEINAVGAGGGSIAWLDAGDILMVGPQSAGANPGPACYGQGGTSPTVTDANLVLNRLSPDTSLAGRIALDRNLALEVLRPLGAKLGLKELNLADGIVQIAVARMVSAIKQISITQGHDPRDFVLCAYGGAGPMHAAFIADELEIGRIIVPVGPGNFCALGSIISDVRRDYVSTRLMQTQGIAFSLVEDTFSQMEEKAQSDLLAEGIDHREIELRRVLGMRYVGQSWELEVPLPGSITSLEALDEAFFKIYQRRFGQNIKAPTEIVTFRLAALGRGEKPKFSKWRGLGGLEDAKLAERDVYFGGSYLPTAIYDRQKLSAGVEINGPAIIEESGATTIVPPAWRAVVQEFGHLMLERR